MSTIVRPAIDIEARRAEIQHEIHQMYADFEGPERQTDDQQHYINRNILLVGPSKGGKTTFRHVLADPRYVPEELSLRAESQTEATCERNIHLPSSNITLNIVELPEKMIGTKHSLSEIDAACKRLGLQDFHLVCLCVSFNTGINGIALESFERLINYLGQEKVRPNLCLIVTRCESKDDAQREKLRDEVVNDVDYKRISCNLGRGIYFSGALNPDDWNRPSEALLDQFETIYNYRKSLLWLIQADIEPFHLTTQQPKSSKSSSTSRLFSKNFSDQKVES
jgi:hypothetical protein